MKINPELKRYFWLDFSLHRVLLTLLIVGLLCYIFDLLFSESKSADLAFDITCFFIFLWGAKNASEAVTTEINNRTWDFQRQTALSPWSMAWGKLLGSTLFSWYGALISFALYAFTKENISSLDNQLSVTQECVLLIVGGLFTQALALLFSMQSIDQLSHEKNVKSFRYFLCAAFIGIFATNYCFSNLPSTASETITWHQWEFNRGNFAFVSLCLFLLWSLIGLQRLFSRALHYAHWPWIWALFTLFSMIYFSGLVPSDLFNQANSEEIKLNLSALKDIAFHLPYLTAFNVAFLLTYFALFSDPLNIITYMKLKARYQEKSYNEFFQQLPKWIVSVAFVLIGGMIVIITQKPLSGMLKDVSLTILVITSILFLVRDILLFHYFHLVKPRQNASTTVLVYLFMLYLLLPLLLQALKLSNWIPAVTPSWGQNNTIAFISLLLQIAFLGVLYWHRTKMLFAQRNITNGPKQYSLQKT